MMLRAKLSYVLFLLLAVVATALSVFLIISLNKELIYSFSFPQSNTLPYLLQYTNFTEDLRQSFLEGILVVNLFLSILCYMSFLSYLYFLRYRRLSKKHFGLVYNISTNEPVPFAVIKLQDKQTGKLVRQTVTDIYGRYNLVADTGSYTLSLEQETYKPFTQELELAGNDKQITQNFALVPVNSRRIGLLLRKALNNLNGSITKVGFVLSLILLLFSFNPLNLIILFIFTLQLVLDRSRKEPRNWGSVYDVSTNQRLKGAFVSVFDAKDMHQVASQMTDEKGRFGFLLEDRSQYLLKVTLAGYKISCINQELKSEPLGNDAVAIRLPTGKITDLAIGMEQQYIDPSRKAFT